MSKTDGRFTDEEIKLMVRLIRAYSEATQSEISEDSVLDPTSISMAASVFVNMYAIQTELPVEQLRADFDKAWSVAKDMLEEMGVGTNEPKLVTNQTIKPGLLN